MSEWNLSDLRSHHDSRYCDYSDGDEILFNLKDVREFIKRLDKGCLDFQENTIHAEAFKAFMNYMHKLAGDKLV